MATPFIRRLIGIHSFKFPRRNALIDTIWLNPNNTIHHISCWSLGMHCLLFWILVLERRRLTLFFNLLQDDSVHDDCVRPNWIAVQLWRNSDCETCESRTLFWRACTFPSPVWKPVWCSGTKQPSNTCVNIPRFEKNCERLASYRIIFIYSWRLVSMHNRILETSWLGEGAEIKAGDNSLSSSWSTDNMDYLKMTTSLSRSAPRGLRPTFTK